MAISFTRAPLVAPGDAITAPQFANLAAAFNDRLKSGLGDGPWRIFFYWLSLFRQVRNRDETGDKFPSMGEFFEVYQHVEPTEGEWPLAGPGEPEGANLASQMNAFVFGAEAFGLDDEATRLAEFPWANAEPTDREAWLLAQAQRGAWDPRTGGVASPSFTAARSHWRIRYTKREAHGNSYGGYDPTPEIATDCADSSITNYLYKFTNLLTGVTKDYPGTCPENLDDVSGIVSLPWAYYVILNSGTVDILPTNEWVEGPYYGQDKLLKQDNEGLTRMLQNFAREFRGSASEKVSPTYHLQSAFDFEAFGNSQYHLAPAAGEEFDGVVTAMYPKVTADTDLASGSLLTWNTTGTSRGWFPSCVLASGFIDQSNLAGSVTLELVDTVDGNDVVLHRVAVKPGDGKLWFPSAPFTPNALRVRLASDLKFNPGGGFLSFEFTELMKYKPNVHDLYLFLRVGTVTEGSTPDGVGTNETLSKTLSDSYVKKGCCWNVNGAAAIPTKFAAVNSNGVWDAARRLSKTCRLMRRFEMVPRYAVEGGKSILWFRRHINTVTGAPDAWDGIGPAKDKVVSGDIKAGVPYRCRTDAGAIYNGRTYGKNEEFFGVSGATEYHGEVWEADGIRLVAPPGGYSNRWLLGVEMKPFKDRDSLSIWKPDVVADYFPILNRCHLDDDAIAGNKTLLGHFAYGESAGGRVHFPESPSGYNYASFQPAFFGATNVNVKECDPLDTTCIADRLNFYKSCRLYEPDIEVESVEWESGTGDEEVLRVTLTGRLHHCDTAPASISSDPSTWVVADVQGEPYRSVENGLREYILLQTRGTVPAIKIGDQAINGGLVSPSDIWGSLYPTFRLTKLIPEPYVDGRYTPTSPKKTHFEHDPFAQMELYLRAMCEGYVDGSTSESYACEHGTTSLFDFTWSSLCLQATGNRWFNTFEWSDVDDNRQGHGPLPNTYARASIFNQFSRAINLLDTVRVMIPCTMESRVATDTIIENLQFYGGDGSVAGCGSTEIWTETLPPVPNPDITTGTWTAAGGGGVVITDITVTGNCTGDLWEVKTSRQAIQFRYTPSNEDIQNAIPEGWRSQFLNEQSILFSSLKNYRFLERRQTTDFGAATDCAGHKWTVDGSHWLEFPQTTALYETSCHLTSGTFTSPPIDVRTNLWYSTSGCIGGAEYRWDLSIWSQAVASITIPVV